VPPAPAKLGRPRSDEAHQAILRAALELVSTHGFRAITVNQIAAHAGVGKMSLYRRWPHKAALVMDALLALIGPVTDFPPAPSALESLHAQLHLQARFFCSRYGRLIRTLLAEAQFDPELSLAFRDRWIQPRRAGVLAVLQAATREGALRPGLDLETTVDLLYGPIYYRLQIRTGTLSTRYIDDLFQQVISGAQRPASNPRR
jgi:AcrR family transcriptional regulator